VGLLALLLLYALTAAALAGGVLRVRRGRAEPLSLLTLGLLSLSPVAFTAAGFLPGRALAPTDTLVRVAPWLLPSVVEAVEEDASPFNPLLRDPVAQMLPWQRAAREDLLFNPYQGSGAALLGNGQSAVLFPTEALARQLPPLRAATYSQAARLLLAGWGMLVLALALGLPERAALVAALVYGGCGFLHLWRLHPHSLVAAMAPWILAAVLALVRRPGGRTAAGLAVTGALGLFAGHGETLLIVVLLALPVAGAALWARTRREPAGIGAALAVVRWGAVALLLAGLLAAPALLPFLDNLRVSGEWARRQVDPPAWGHVSAAEALARLAPTLVLHAYGDPREEPDTPGGSPAPGPDNLAELGGGSLGAAALVLAMLTWVAPGRWRVRGLWVVGLLGLAVGIQAPVLSRLGGYLPLLELSLPQRFSLWWVLAGSLLAGLGVGSTGEGRASRKRILLAAGGVGLALLAVAGGLPRTWGWSGVPLEAGVLLATAGLLLFGRSGGRRGPSGWWFAALLAVLLVPRLVLFYHWVPEVPAVSFYPETDALRFLRQRGDPPGFRVAGLDAALFPNTAAFYGLEDVRASDPMTFATYERFLTLAGEVVPNLGLRLVDPHQPVLDFLGVRYFFDHPAMTHRPGVQVVYLGPDAILYENPDALPRLFLPQEVQVTADGGQAMAVARSIDDFGRQVAASGPGLPPPGFYPNGRGRVVSLTVAAGRLDAVVEAESLALVATSQPAIPGWRVLRNGQEVAAVRVNGAFLGVVLEPGTSILELAYRPRSWRWGLSAGAAGLVLAVLLGARRERRQGAGATG
jgi:hypothetical protein